MALVINTILRFKANQFFEIFAFRCLVDQCDRTRDGSGLFGPIGQLSASSTPKRLRQKEFELQCPITGPNPNHKLLNFY